jgi:hypothetical protein
MAIVRTILVGTLVVFVPHKRLRRYDFPWHLSNNEPAPSARVPSTKVSFSSYGGVLNSGDDFYVLSSGLVQWETTIGNSNVALASEFISPLAIPEWVGEPSLPAAEIAETYDEPS